MDVGDSTPVLILLRQGLLLAAISSPHWFFFFFNLKKQYYECKIKSKALQEALVREGSPRQVGVMVTLSLQTLFLAG